MLTKTQHFQRTVKAPHTQHEQKKAAYKMKPMAQSCYRSHSCNTQCYVNSCNRQWFVNCCNKQCCVNNCNRKCCVNSCNRKCRVSSCQTITVANLEWLTNQNFVNESVLYRQKYNQIIFTSVRCISWYVTLSPKTLFFYFILVIRNIQYLDFRDVRNMLIYS